MRTCEYCSGGLSGKRAGTRFCSDRCRKRWHGRGKPLPVSGGDGDAGELSESNEAAVSALIDVLEAEGRLNGCNRSVATVALNLAQAVDADSRSPGLWAQFRDAHRELLALGESEADAYAELMAELEVM